MKLAERTGERGICLTEEEAIGLLELVMLCPAELDPEQRKAMLKLSEFCRQFLRESADNPQHRLASRPPLAANYAA